MIELVDSALGSVTVGEAAGRSEHPDGLPSRGHCAGYKCSCRAWLPVPGTLTDAWPRCGSCPHSMQTHRVAATA